MKKIVKTLMAFLLGATVIALVDISVAYFELEDAYNDMSEVLSEVILESRKPAAA